MFNPRDDYQVIRKYLENLWSCVEGALKKVPELKGRLADEGVMSGAKENMSR
jgi:hypothetical protein